MLRLLRLTVILLWLAVGPSCLRAADPITPGCTAEWNAARVALLHEPAEELWLGVLHPPAALFERAFSTPGAVREHRVYCNLLESRGVRVMGLTDALLTGSVDVAGDPVTGPALDRLRALARASMSIECRDFPDPAAEQAAQAKLLDESLTKLHPRDLVRTIIMRPRIELRSTGALNTGYTARYELQPLMNLYFQRDQVITTARGVVMGRMNSEQRQHETEVVRLALRNLGVAPLGEIAEPGRLEGGDFLPAAQRAFIGQGLRTNAAAVQQLLDRNWFGAREVVVVKDQWQQQEQMHLDTYFNLASAKVCVIAENRLSAATNAPQRLTADVYRRTETGYERSRQDVDFVSLLKNELGMTIVPVSAADQARYGVNFLNLGNSRVCMVRGVSGEYVARLSGLGIQVEQVEFTNLTGGYGACHCTVQVLQRGAD